MTQSIRSVENGSARNIDEWALEAKKEAVEREALLAAYRPFLLRVLSEQLGRYIEVENDEAFAIGLEALDEAILRYDMERGHFLSFAQRVIKSRVIDHLRESEETIALEEEHIEIADNSDVAYKAQLKLELIRYRELLIEHGLSFQMVADNTPVQYPTRKRAVTIARCVSESPMVRKLLMDKKKLPIKATAQVAQTTVKIIKGSKVFIHALALCFIDELETLINYLESMEKGGGSS